MLCLGFAYKDMDQQQFGFICPTSMPKWQVYTVDWNKHPPIKIFIAIFFFSS